ncbi:uncharacterized protein LOC132366929 isoform X5 [Balaenoptera ricei]|uniref:uncharacterized protein LOC132366929 isoform X5 n=1 Tax=Balaenoptera ricei TaxID=2746895 RepID=UPI0028BE8093|nr:uncharacterized protein LOC132366929 isoform X5 [Balaenoptera ricei]
MEERGPYIGLQFRAYTTLWRTLPWDKQRYCHIASPVTESSEGHSTILSSLLLQEPVRDGVASPAAPGTGKSKCVTLIDLWILNNPCIPRINPSCSGFMSERKSLADLAGSCISVDVCSRRPAESGTKKSGAAAAGRLRSRAQAANLVHMVTTKVLLPCRTLISFFVT